jgi:hypothetical protein
MLIYPLSIASSSVDLSRLDNKIATTSAIIINKPPLKYGKP